METQNKPVRKPELKKRTISQLSQKQMNYDGGGSWTISYASVGCMTDFTRPNTTIIISISGITR
jgi:hypothetical protein